MPPGQKSGKQQTVERKRRWDSNGSKQAHPCAHVGTLRAVQVELCFPWACQDEEVTSCCHKPPELPLERGAKGSIWASPRAWHHWIQDKNTQLRLEKPIGCIWCSEGVTGVLKNIYWEHFCQGEKCSRINCANEKAKTCQQLQHAKGFLPRVGFWAINLFSREFCIKYLGPGKISKIKLFFTTVFSILHSWIRKEVNTACQVKWH